MIGVSRLFPVIAALSLATSAAASPWSNGDCDYGNEHQWLPCLVARSGAPSGASLDAEKRQFLQILLVKNERGIVIRFERKPDGSVDLEFRDLGREHPVQAFTAPSDKWRKLEAAWKKLPSDIALAEAARQEEDARNKQAGIDTICLHPWLARIESNKSGSLDTIDANACYDPAQLDFAVFVADTALASAPPCRLLDDGAEPFSPVQLLLCLKLQGDRAAAALVFNAAESLGEDARENREKALENYRRVIAPSGVLKFAGRPGAVGPEAVADAWATVQTQMSDGGLSIDDVRGFTDHAVVSGVVWKNVKPTPGGIYARYYSASSRQIWRRQPDGSFKLASWTVGPFVFDPTR